MDLPGYFKDLYEYDRWANRRILDAAEALSVEQFNQPQVHSWGSVRGLLFHMISAQWIWLSRWRGESPKAFPSNENAQTLKSLREHWSQVEADIQAYVEALTPDGIDREVTYTTTKGKTYTLKMWQMLTHVVNHDTHHRGELAAMFAQMGIQHQEDEMNMFFLGKTGQSKV